MAGAGKRDRGKAKPTDTDQPPTEFRPPVGKRTRVDWVEVRRDYVTGNEGISALAARHGINRSMVAERSSAEGWPDERAKHRAKVDTKTTAAITKAQIASESEIDGLAHRLALRLLKRAERMLGKVVGDTDDGADGAVGEPGDLKAVTQAIGEAWALARKTAHLSADPAPAAQEGGDGVIRIRRRDPSGAETEVEFGPSAGTRPDRQDADADATRLPAGPDEDPGAGGRSGLGQDDVGG